MKRFLLTISALFGLILVSFAQTEKLTGKVLNSKNEPVVKASINIEGTNIGTTSSVDGEFSLSLTIGKKYILIISSTSYETKKVEVEVVAGQLNELQISLTESTKNTLTGVTVTASSTTARKETQAAMVQFQKNTNTVASVISAENIRRSPDKNTGEVLKRTPGTSIMEGRFIVVRGLADRYNQAMLNGILLTSTEPDRKTFSFDLIPAQMIDNIIINKAFVPEYPGEWAGGLIQVNTKDIPSKNFFNVQVGTGFNSQTIGNKFYRDQKGGNLDWLGIDDGTRGFPDGYTTKYKFSLLSPAEKTAIGKGMRNAWTPNQTSGPWNASFQANGGFATTLFHKKVGGTFGILYSKSNKHLEIENRRNVIDLNYNTTVETDFHDEKYVQETSVGGLASVSMQLNPLNKISVKSLINVNSNNFVTLRNGIDISRNDKYLQGTEFSFKQNTFFTTQISGEHSISKPLVLKWYGAFNILDGYIPDQRRLLYSRASETDPWRAVIANSLSQQSGSRIYQSLSDYIYTAGGDLTYKFKIGEASQTVKGGYMFQVKDRLYDAVLFANYLPNYNDALLQLPSDKIFQPQNFGDGSKNSTLFAFNSIAGRTYRYMANTILNAGFIQFDNQLAKDIRVVWGLRVEDYDQLVGSVKTWDERHTHTDVTDFLPGLNATWKINPKSNLRLSASQTVVRPELRELAALNLYDFELNASVQGNPDLKRTKIINTDLRYELYPGAGQVFTIGVFYKHFKDPIEQLLNEGGGGASTFAYQNPEKAIAYGAELEFRKKLDFAEGFKNFTLQGNVAYIHSRVTDEGFDLNRPLQGQSPYVLNFGLLYDLEKAGFNATLLFNEIGERIYLVGDKSAGAGTPDTYEAPRPLIDFQLAKKLLNKKAELRLNINDLLNKTQYFYQNTSDKHTFQKNSDAYRFTRKAGTNFSLTFNYSL